MINCKFESKLKLKKHCVLAAADVENFDTNSKNIDFTIKDKKPYVLKSNFLGSLCWFIQIKIKIQKIIKPKYIIYQNLFLETIMWLSMKRTFMTNPSILL